MNSLIAAALTIATILLVSVTVAAHVGDELRLGSTAFSRL
jgi:hypothetical protein